ncbi:uncharacterized protein LOC129311442 [Prosopis cineraria]|uniref:uncharacterized protein LOC129311442 n=1 Tax=Prosopis cineraria TaxID=364024 RepID=UPI0024103D43|nr:uncharacterized protein LOC129311442 [Prosopis cineraria]
MAAGDEKHSGKWRYTWEAQSHVPTLRLLLFAKNANPSLQCLNLKVLLLPSQSLVAVSWLEPTLVSLRVPIPRVLVDFESPPSSRALDDHIEVKLLLVLPVDHPIVSSFDSVMNLSDDPVNVLPDVSKPLIMESDVKNLSSRASVHFYCRSCSFKLTRNPLRSLVEMPSVNWREVADNWFGACCCSFGGISEKLVIKYANSYTCAPGVCLLSSTSITICKDDLIEYNFLESGGEEECNPKSDNFEEGINKASIKSEMSMERSSTCSEIGKTIYNSDGSSRFADSENENLHMNLGLEAGKVISNHDDFSRSYPDSNVPADVAMAPSRSALMASSVPHLENEDWKHQCCENARKEHRDTAAMEILASQKSFLNGFLEDVFMARSSNLVRRVCLLSSTSITICKDDLIEYNFLESGGEEECNPKSDNFEEGINKASLKSEMSMERSSTCSEIGKTIYNSDGSSRFADSENENLHMNLGLEAGKVISNHDDFSRSYPDSNVPADVAMAPSRSALMASSVPHLENEDWKHQCCENARKEHRDTAAMEILASQKSFLNGFLEDVFMARSSNLSEDIDWCEFMCPQCKSVLGAYPSCKGDAPVDGGVRLFKCNISTCLPTRGSGDLFRQYTMGKMFANKLIECANDESSFRFVVMDLKAKSPTLQIISLCTVNFSISFRQAWGFQSELHVLIEVRIHREQICPWLCAAGAPALLLYRLYPMPIKHIVRGSLFSF